MEVFIDRFISKCKEIQQEPPRSIIDHCKLTTSRNGDATTLNLTGLSLTPKICQALGHAIRDDQQFSKIIIADAFLGDDGTVCFIERWRQRKEEGYYSLVMLQRALPLPTFTPN